MPNYKFVRRSDRGKDLVLPPGPPCKTLATMTDAEVEEMTRLYGPLSRRARIARAAAKKAKVTDGSR